MDRFFTPYVAVAAGGCILLMSSDIFVLYLAALPAGLPAGSELDILAYSMSRYFGLAGFGRCYSLGYSFMILAGGVNPVLIAHLAPMGDYSSALIVSSVGLALSAIAVGFLPRLNLPSKLEASCAAKLRSQAG